MSPHNHTPHRGLVKICGLRDAETLGVALDAGADMVGFVFYPRSPRHVELAQAAALAHQAQGRAGRVALVVDADDAALDALLGAVAIDLLQCHGHESPQRVAAIKARTGLPVMKAVGIASAADLATLAAYASVADMLLLDAKPPADPSALPGGNGLSFDWNLITNLDLPLPFMLSGGLDPANVGAAIRLTGVRGVDVSSGVEQTPGQKDPARIRAFISAARQAFADRQEIAT